RMPNAPASSMSTPGVSTDNQNGVDERDLHRQERHIRGLLNNSEVSEVVMQVKGSAASSLGLHLCSGNRATNVPLTDIVAPWERATMIGWGKIKSVTTAPSLRTSAMGNIKFLGGTAV